MSISELITPFHLGRKALIYVRQSSPHQVVARVTLDQVGIIFSYDVTRLSRNCTDWYPVLDPCGHRRGLIGDRDGIYDPATINGRLLLGLKGQISELELHTIKARLTAGLINKAQRGELALTLPVGLSRDALGRVVKRPDREVQDRLISSSPPCYGSAPSPRSSNHSILRTCSCRDAIDSATSSGDARRSPPWVPS